MLATTAAPTIDIRRTSPSDSAALTSFLGRMFEPEAVLGERHMYWKYWSPRPDWSGSRSFIACRDGTIVAHAAVWPVRIRVHDQTFSALHAVDWAADPACPGAGLRVLRKVGSDVRLMIATGGTAITRCLLPVVGFRAHGVVYSFARPVRPLRQLRTTSARSPRLAGRFLRNALWHAISPVRCPSGWSAVPMDPEDIPDSLWPLPSAGTAVTARDAGFFRYFVESPSARHVLFGLANAGTLVGYFCLSFGLHVARIADLWLPSTNPDDWRAAFKTAAAVAAREPDVCEVSAWASTPIGTEGLGRAGFRPRDCSALTLLGDAKLLGGRALHVQMLDCDASFLSGSGVSYLT
jgi:GNAT acetyltransferase-like protein